MSKIIKAGIDIGSSSLKIAFIDSENNLIGSPIYSPHGRDLEKILEHIKTNLQPYRDTEFYLAMFGAFSGEIASAMGAERIAEIQAHIFGAPEEAGYIIDVGAESCKFITKEEKALLNFKSNSKCASGTGSFIEEQSKAMLYESLDDFFQDAEKAERIAPIIARCAVFAKSRRVTASSKGFSAREIVKGLVNCIAKNLYSDVVKIEEFKAPLTVHGRLAEQELFIEHIKAARKIPDEYFIPAEYPSCQAVIGAARAIDSQRYRYDFADLDKAKLKRTRIALEPSLRLRGGKEKIYLNTASSFQIFSPADHNYVIGIDIGSRSTVLGLVEVSSRTLEDAVYLNTEGKPLVATRKGIQYFLDKYKGRLKIKAVATTGSSRYAVGYFINSDFIEDEITAQAIGGLHLAEQLGLDLRCVVEIGGQDSKYIEILNNVVLFSAMNQICSAGTGTFLEEQASKLLSNITSNQERLDLFDRLALESSGVYNLHGRCTTFMKKECDYASMNSVGVSNICAGIAVGIARNYSNEFKELGDLIESMKLVPDPNQVIFFQGGTARNVSVLAALQELHGFDRFVVPPNCAETGALGIALYAIERVKQSEAQNNLAYETRFAGIDADFDFKQRSLTCKGCENYCEVSRITTADDRTIYDGQKCDKIFRNQDYRSKEPTPIDKSRCLLFQNEP